MDETIAIWGKANACQIDAQPSIRETNLEEYAVYVCKQGRLEVHRLKGVGHIWSGWILAKLKDPFIEQKNATQIFWDFFMSVSS